MEYNLTNYFAPVSAYFACTYFDEDCKFVLNFELKKFNI